MFTDRHIDVTDPKYRKAAARILRVYDHPTSEADVTSAIRDFLVETELVNRDEISEEYHPAEGSLSAVDLTALDTFIEVKVRIGMAGPGIPDPRHVAQLDYYLEQSAQDGRVRMGILTDGKYWLLRWPGAGEVRLTRPWFMTLDSSARLDWVRLYDWLRDDALVSLENIPPDRRNVAARFSPESPNYQRDISVLSSLYREAQSLETIRVKRQLWRDLLRTALGEIVHNDDKLDDLFIRHTYLSAVIGMVVQASFGIDIRQLAEDEPEDLLNGRRFRNDTGLAGIVESDFFSWPEEVGGGPWLQSMARRVATFDWKSAPPDIGVVLYQGIIPADERRQLGEYYTPDWLARSMVEELVTDPLSQRVLDPACGSGTFIAEAVAHFIKAALPEGASPQLHPKNILERLQDSVIGIDVHPVAVHLARAAWALSARPAIAAASEQGFYSSMSIPVYLGDSLQLRYRTGDLFAENEITIQTQDEENTELVFPVSLVDRPENFDSLMVDVSRYIEEGGDPFPALDYNHISDPWERETLESTITAMQKLHEAGRNHIWAYYTRNMVRPVALSRRKVDVVIGNPPWINYNQTSDVLREEMLNLSRDRYGIWVGGRYATHQDVASLFFVRCVDLYLGQRGLIGFVMPHSALQSGQHSRWRTGKWESPPTGRGKARAPSYTLSVEFNQKTAWDLERLEPNNFFPVPACVVFARSTGNSGVATPLTGNVERWLGAAGAPDNERVSYAIADTRKVGDSPYAALSRNGATIFPRCLFFVNETDNPAIIQAGQTITVNPRRGVHDHSPWKDLDLTTISGQTIERAHLFDVHLGETIAPYVTLEPLNALLPLKQGESSTPKDENGPGGIRLGALQQQMRQRWQTVSHLWDANRKLTERKNLQQQVDYMGKLSAQLQWQQNPGDRPVRIVYTSSGEPTAALLDDGAALAENVLYWIPCRDRYEAHYLLAIINSETLYSLVKPLMPKGQFGARHLHKHLWKLPIPEFDPKQKLHMVIAQEPGSGRRRGPQQKLAEVREERGEKFSVTIARDELRNWLRSSAEGKEVEAAVAALLGQGVDYRGTITIEPDKRFGKPCIRGIRMTVQDVMEYLAGGESWADFLEDFYNLTESDLYACLSFAAAEQMDDDYSRLRYAVI